MKPFLTRAFLSVALIGATLGISRPAQAQEPGKKLSVVLRAVSWPFGGSEGYKPSWLSGIGVEYRYSNAFNVSAALVKVYGSPGEVVNGLRLGVGTETTRGSAGIGINAGLAFVNDDGLGFMPDAESFARFGKRDDMSVRIGKAVCPIPGCHEYFDLPKVVNLTLRAPTRLIGQKLGQ